MNYYVLSSLQTENHPISLVGNAILFENLEKLDIKAEYSYYPWYDIELCDTCDTCELPKNGVLFLEDENLNIFFHRIKYNLYVINQEIKEIINKYIDCDFLEIDIVNRKKEIISDTKYYIFRLMPSVDYDEFLDLDKSIYKFSDGFLVLEAPRSSKQFDKNLFKIRNIDIGQDTIFINEELKNEFDRLDDTGFNIFDLDIAKWRDPYDFFSSLYLSEEEINELVWPI